MKNLKTITVALILCLTTTMSLGQMQIDSFYDNKAEYLIYSIVEEFDSISQEELSVKVKNWGGINFVNMKEVLVSETKEQLVFNYITKSFFIKTLLSGTNSYSWYVRMVIQIKDNKIKVSLFDDGNSFWPGYYNGSVNIPSTPARSYKFANYFKNGTCKKLHNDGLENVRKFCILTAADLVNSIKSGTTHKLDSDW